MMPEEHRIIKRTELNVYYVELVRIKDSEVEK